METVRVRRVGNSNVVSLPRATGLSEGDEVRVETLPDGSVRLRRPAGRGVVTANDLRWAGERLVEYEELLGYLRDH